jgi:hypothetical protein
MKERRHKVHFAHSRSEGVGLCGLDGNITRMANMTTCRICMYRYLSEQATWAPGFLNDLRGKGTGVAVAAGVLSADEARRRMNLQQQGYHITVEPSTDAQRAGRQSPAIKLEYMDRYLFGPEGPLTPTQEADLETFCGYVRSIQIEAASGHVLDVLCGIPARQPGVTDEQLRELARSGQAQTVPVPAGLPAKVDGKVKGLGDGFARAFSQQCDPQEIVRILLAVDAPGDGPVQPVMQDGGPAADAGGVQKGKVAEDSGNTG